MRKVEHEQKLFGTPALTLSKGTHLSIGESLRITKTTSLDVTAFFRLGGVFASVMTSNLVFVGVAVVKTEAAFGVRCAVAILSYIVGVGLASAIVWPLLKSSSMCSSLRSAWQTSATRINAIASCDGVMTQTRCWLKNLVASKSSRAVSAAIAPSMGTYMKVRLGLRSSAFQ